MGNWSRASDWGGELSWLLIRVKEALIGVLGHLLEPSGQLTAEKTIQPLSDMAHPEKDKDCAGNNVRKGHRSCSFKR